MIAFRKTADMFVPKTKPFLIPLRPQRDWSKFDSPTYRHGLRVDSGRVKRSRTATVLTIQRKEG